MASALRSSSLGLFLLPNWWSSFTEVALGGRPYRTWVGEMACLRSHRPSVSRSPLFVVCVSKNHSFFLAWEEETI